MVVIPFYFSIVGGTRCDLRSGKPYEVGSGVFSNYI